jgi:hypothetical protein
MATKRRTKVEMQELDRLIRPLYEGGLSCSIIGSRLEANQAVVFKRVQAMGIGRTHRDSLLAAPIVPLPFHGEVDEKHLRTAAIGEAASWFLERGYVASIPLATTQYDLITESDEGFRRVQVKSTTSKDRGGRWVVGICRMEYGAAEENNSNGSRRKRPYRPDEVDLFFILTGNGEKYLIPLDATSGSLSLTLDEKYAAYKVG